MPSDRPLTYDVSIDMVHRLDCDPNLLHLVGMIDPLRPGVSLTARRIELELFRPGTPNTDNLNVISLGWAEMRFGLLSFPLRYRADVEQIVAECGMRMANGFPHVMTRGAVAVFPMKSSTVFTLENTSASIVYAGQTAREEAIRLEARKILEVERRHRAWFATLTRVYFNGRWWTKLLPGQKPPADVTELMNMRDAHPDELWYTTQASNPDWLPYPR